MKKHSGGRSGGGGEGVESALYETAEAKYQKHRHPPDPRQSGAERLGQGGREWEPWSLLTWS